MNRYTITVVAAAAVTVVSVVVIPVSDPQELTARPTLPARSDYVNRASTTNLVGVAEVIDVMVVSPASEQFPASKMGQYPYPTSLVRTFGISLVLSGLGVIAGIVYLIAHAYAAALLGSFSFAVGSFGIAATLLKGEQILDQS